MTSYKNTPWKQDNVPSLDLAPDTPYKDNIIPNGKQSCQTLSSLLCDRAVSFQISFIIRSFQQKFAAALQALPGGNT